MSQSHGAGTGGARGSTDADTVPDVGGVPAAVFMTCRGPDKHDHHSNQHSNDSSKFSSRGSKHYIDKYSNQPVSHGIDKIGVDFGYAVAVWPTPRNNIAVESLLSPLDYFNGFIHNYCYCCFLRNRTRGVTGCGSVCRRE